MSIKSHKILMLQLDNKEDKKMKFSKYNQPRGRRSTTKRKDRKTSFSDWLVKRGYNEMYFSADEQKKNDIYNVYLIEEG